MTHPEDEEVVYDPACPVCGGELVQPVNGECRPCHERELRREKDEQRA